MTHSMPLPQMPSNSRRKRRWLYALAFVLFLTGSLLWTMPIGLLNRVLPSSVQLLNATGNISAGRFQDVQINGKRYPLACRYQRQSLGVSGATYAIACDTPFALEATLSARFNGDVSFTDGLLSGDIADAAPWLRLLGVPVSVSGPVGLNLARADIEGQTLTHLEVNGGVQYLMLFDQPVLQHIRIETLNSQLSPMKNIQLEIRTQENQSVSSAKPTTDSDQQTVRLYALSEIDGKNYLTKGEISGEMLANYASVLRFFGRQTRHNSFVIELQGDCFDEQ